jgi:hypothetical protein
MFGDFLGSFFVFGERASSGIPHNFSGEIHRSDFLFARSGFLFLPVFLKKRLA